MLSRRSGVPRALAVPRLLLGTVALARAGVEESLRWPGNDTSAGLAEPVAR
ncbi:hypothetical protein MED01_000724 [Micromonospora sp. MED01]|uniref:hypothetical protein n=1 Tax=Micromonospora alfalfae TaxID=2911212 RepID=UPI001EE8888B|nr:hypothetical protein [Micromonospora alfalfae]MCG5462619.1 hypothetical protein [Micromonospora alfalfae]